MAVRILFLCHGNICRSPMAEFVMKRLVRDAGLQNEYVIESAATTYEEIGNPVYPPAVRELKKHGISCEGKTARRMVKEDYERFDHLIGMDKENLDDMTSFFAPDPGRKISLLLWHAGKALRCRPVVYGQFHGDLERRAGGLYGAARQNETTEGMTNGTPVYLFLRIPR